MADTCAYDDCTCDLGKDKVMREGEAYCSKACADGDGCTHADCNCADA